MGDWVELCCVRSVHCICNPHFPEAAIKIQSVSRRRQSASTKPPPSPPPSPPDADTPELTTRASANAEMTVAERIRALGGGGGATPSRLPPPARFPREAPAPQPPAPAPAAAAVNTEAKEQELRAEQAARDVGKLENIGGGAQVGRHTAADTSKRQSDWSRFSASSRQLAQLHSLVEFSNIVQVRRLVA